MKKYNPIKENISQRSRKSKYNKKTWKCYYVKTQSKEVLEIQILK